MATEEALSTRSVWVLPAVSSWPWRPCGQICLVHGTGEKLGCIPQWSRWQHNWVSGSLPALCLLSRGGWQPCPGRLSWTTQSIQFGACCPNCRPFIRLWGQQAPHPAPVHGDMGKQPSTTPATEPSQDLTDSKWGHSALLYLVSPGRIPVPTRLMFSLLLLERWVWINSLTLEFPPFTGCELCPSHKKLGWCAGALGTGKVNSWGSFQFDTCCAAAQHIELPSPHFGKQLPAQALQPDCSCRSVMGQENFFFVKVAADWGRKILFPLNSSAFGCWWRHTFPWLSGYCKISQGGQDLNSSCKRTSRQKWKGNFRSKDVCCGEWLLAPPRACGHCESSKCALLPAGGGSFMERSNAGWCW